MTLFNYCLLAIDLLLMAKIVSDYLDIVRVKQHNRILRGMLTKKLALRAVQRTRKDDLSNHIKTLK
jgi:hypothetical protein